MFSHYRLDIACLCCIVFICLCFLCFGLKNYLIWFLIEFLSFWLLIHLVSSPNDIVMLLCILIRWVVFIVIFRDEFPTFCQRFLVFVMRERFMVRNPKNGFEFGVRMPVYGWRTREVREGACSAKGQARRTTCATQPESLSAPMWHTCPTQDVWRGTFWLAFESPLFSISFPSIYIRNLVQNSLQLLISYFDYISLISTLNQVIQKPKMLVLKRGTSPKHL